MAQTMATRKIIKISMGFFSRINISILLKKSFSKNQEKMFRSQMPYNERSELG